MTSKRLAVAAAWIGIAFFAITGAWALLAPRSFFDSVATYPPYNHHLFHDIGSFTLGIAAALVAAVARRPALAVGLWAGAAAATLHAVSHWIDRDLGGRVTDAPLLTLLAAVLVAGLVAAERRR